MTYWKMNIDFTFVVSYINHVKVVSMRREKFIYFWLKMSSYRQEHELFLEDKLKKKKKKKTMMINANVV
jgi:hypothetical protein